MEERGGRYVAAVRTDADADDVTVELRNEAGERDGGEPRCRIDGWRCFLGVMELIRELLRNSSS